MDSRTTIEITWDPANVFPSVEDTNSFMVDVYIYTYDYSRSYWTLNSKIINQPNNGRALLRMGLLLKRVLPTLIHVTLGQVNESSCDKVIRLIESIHATISLPFPSRVGVWSGLFFSVFNSRTVSNESAEQIRRDIFNRRCSGWHNRISETIPDYVIESLPPCPPSLDRAQLPNSGLEEERFESSLYTTNYHSQWMSTFHPGVSVCFVQSIVTR